MVSQNLKKMSKREFITIEEGTTYGLSKWEVIDGKGIIDTGALHEITFVRGDKEDNGTIIPRVDGVLHETLLSMMIADLKFKNSLVPSRESSLAITKLEEGLMWMEERQRNRVAAGVQGTYKKH